MDDFAGVFGNGGRPHRRKVKDLNIVPILDMLTTVIFFLLLSTSFIEYTQVTVPPSSIKSQSPEDPPPPVAPKLFLLPAGARSAGGVPSAARLMLTWNGPKSGTKSAAVAFSGDLRDRRAKILDKSRELVQSFAKDYPKERTLQLGLGTEMPYQDLISLMDGVRPSMPDVVLISYHEAHARGESQPMESTSAEAPAGGQ